MISCCSTTFGSRSTCKGSEKWEYLGSKWLKRYRNVCLWQLTIGRWVTAQVCAFVLLKSSDFVKIFSRSALFSKISLFFQKNRKNRTHVNWSWCTPSNESHPQRERLSKIESDCTNPTSCYGLVFPRGTSDSFQPKSRQPSRRWSSYFWSGEPRPG